MEPAGVPDGVLALPAVGVLGVRGGARAAGEPLDRTRHRSAPSAATIASSDTGR
jgi:hypothetical protein